MVNKQDKLKIANIIREHTGMGISDARQVVAAGDERRAMLAGQVANGLLSGGYVYMVDGGLDSQRVAVDTLALTDALLEELEK